MKIVLKDNIVSKIEEQVRSLTHPSLVNQIVLTVDEFSELEQIKWPFTFSLDYTGWTRCSSQDGMGVDYKYAGIPITREKHQFERDEVSPWDKVANGELPPAFGPFVPHKEESKEISIDDCVEDQEYRITMDSGAVHKATFEFGQFFYIEGNATIVLNKLKIKRIEKL